MLRLCSDSSRSYPGRSAPLCISQERRGAVMVAVMEQKSAKAIVGVGRRPHAIGRLETSRVIPEALPRRRAERRMGRSPNELS
jgi:hypothetical protein